MLEVIKKHNLPLDKIVHVEVMATAEISADLPELAEWKKHADIKIKERYGIEVTHVTAATTYEREFYSIPMRTPKNIDKQGTILGFPSLRNRWCTSRLKTDVMHKLFAEDSVQYIGIAADETKRLGQLTKRLKAPLVEYSITEAQSFDICKRLGLLAPSYINSMRSGCWFCHAQPIKQLRMLYMKYPELWQLLLKWDNDSPVFFRFGVRHGNHSVHDFDKRFRLEAQGKIQDDFKFKWAMLDMYT